MDHDTKTDMAKVASDNAADCIALLPLDQWRHWAVYILEVLDRRARFRSDGGLYDPEAADDLMEDILNDIQTRTRTGSW